MGCPDFWDDPYCIFALESNYCLTSKVRVKYGKFRTVASFDSSFYGTLGGSGLRGRRVCM